MERAKQCLAILPVNEVCFNLWSLLGDPGLSTRYIRVVMPRISGEGVQPLFVDIRTLSFPSPRMLDLSNNGSGREDVSPQRYVLGRNWRCFLE